MASEMRNYTLRVWRQDGPDAQGRFATYQVEDISPDSSFLEMMDLLNEKITKDGKERPIEFESDCREGICGTCGLMVNGNAHGPGLGIAACQVYMRSFEHNSTITIEPFRAKSFPVIRDLAVDRGALDRIIAAGGYVSVGTGGHADANTHLISKDISDKAFDAAACIGCGACVAACPNASPSLFTGAKVTHLSMLPQGAPERKRRVRRMVEQMDAEGFGHCGNIGECAAACPKRISLDVISKMKRDYLIASLTGE